MILFRLMRQRAALLSTFQRDVPELAQLTLNRSSFGVQTLQR